MSVDFCGLFVRTLGRLAAPIVREAQVQIRNKRAPEIESQSHLITQRRLELHRSYLTAPELPPTYSIPRGAIRTFADLRAFAESHVPTRAWIEHCKDELVAEFGHESIVRIMAEDLLVCGAACFERGESVDVATISVLVDNEYKRPEPPAPAYMQTVAGGQRLFTADYLTYLPLPAGGLYASSPVEQFMKVRQVVKQFLDAK